MTARDTDTSPREQDSETHRQVWHQIRDRAIRLLETEDTASVFSRQNILPRLREAVYSTPDRQMRSLVKHRSKGEISRRTFLKLLGIGTTGTVLASGGIGYFMGQKIFDERPRPTGYVTAGGMSFDNVLNGVEEGLDPTGNDPVDAQLEDLINNNPNTLVDLDCGTYFVEESVDLEPDSAGFRGKGSAPSDVRFTSSPGSKNELLSFRGGDGLFMNWAIDQGRNWDRLYGVRISTSGTYRFIGHRLIGTEPSEPDLGVGGGDTKETYFSACCIDGHLVIDGFIKVGPTHYTAYPGNRSLIYSDGTARVELWNWYIENGAGSTIYTGQRNLEVTVEESFFRNALDKSIRLTGRDSTVRNCTIIMDHDSQWEEENRITENQGKNATGIWVFTGGTRNTVSGPVIEDCDLIWRQIHSDWNSRGMINNNKNVGGAIIRNCRFINDTGAPTIIAEAPSSKAGEPYELEIEGCHFTGSGNAVAVQVEGRPNSTMTDCCVDMPNGGDIAGVQDTDISHGSCQQADPSPPLSEPRSLQ